MFPIQELSFIAFKLNIFLWQNVRVLTAETAVTCSNHRILWDQNTACVFTGRQHFVITQRLITKRFLVSCMVSETRDTNRRSLSLPVCPHLRVSNQVLPDRRHRPNSISFSGPTHVFSGLYLLQHTNTLPEHAILLSSRSTSVCL